MENTDRAKTVQKPCTHGLQNKKAMKSFDFTAFSGAMEGTRTPGLLIRKNRIAHFVHFIIQRQIAISIELPSFCRCCSIVFFALLASNYRHFAVVVLLYSLHCLHGFTPIIHPFDVQKMCKSVQS